MFDETITFSLNDKKDRNTRDILEAVYFSLKEKGYNPVNQLVGYILSGDPTYITTHNSARSLICRIDRDELMEALIRNYLNIESNRRKR